MKKRLTQILLSMTALLIVDVALIACGPGRVGTSTEDQETRWLKGIPCRPPCWEGITPGETPADDAIKLLAQNSYIRNPRKDVGPLFPDLGFVEWDWTIGAPRGRILFHAQAESKTVFQIQPNLPASVKLPDVLQVFGEPSHVLATASPNPDIGSGLSRGLTLIFLPHGFALPVAAIPPKLSPDMVTFGPVFFTPTEQGLAEAIAGTGFAVPWQGFKEYEFYCRDLEGGQACRGK